MESIENKILTQVKRKPKGEIVFAEETINIFHSNRNSIAKNNRSRQIAAWIGAGYSSLPLLKLPLLKERVGVR